MFDFSGVFQWILTKSPQSSSSTTSLYNNPIKKPIGISLLVSLILANTLFGCDCLKIRPKLCSNALGEEGTCMFVWECIKTEGKHLGTCVDGFLFGSCCGHNASDNSINNNMELSTTTTITNPPTTTTVNSQQFLATKNKIKWKQNSTTTTSTRNPPSTTTSTTTIITTTTTTTTESPSPSVLPPSTTTASTITSSHHFVTSKPWTTSQRPWVIYTGRPPSIGPLFSTTRRPIIIWPITNIHSHRPITNNNSDWNSSMVSSSSNERPTLVTNRPSINQTTTDRVSSITTNKPQITTEETVAIQQSNNNNNNNSGLTTTISNNDHTKNSPSSPTTNIKHSQQQCGISEVKLRQKSGQQYQQTEQSNVRHFRVVGGKNSAFGAWPWQVSVRRISFFGFSSTHRCGGAILNSQWIATAGHCVDDLVLTQIRIRVGEYDFSSSLEPLPHQERGAKKKIVHPKYNYFTYENDLALVQLDKPIELQPHVSPICLPPDNIELLGRNATVTGWGRLSEGGVLPTVLQEVRVPIISNDKCKNMFLSAGRHEIIPDIFMCAGYDAGGRDSCQGDSGGPLQVQNDDGRWFLAGIISWGIGCGEPSLPGVCTRITKFKQWILSYINSD